MQDELTKRRASAEITFNELIKLKEHVDTKLAELSVISYQDVETELARLQGEYRVIDALLEKTTEPSPVSPEAEIVNVDAALEVS